MFPEGIAANSSFANSPNSPSNHHKLSQSYADANITVGVDDVLSIPIKFGTPVYETKDSSGDLVWVYQARTSAVSTQGKFGSNYNHGILSGSTASAFEVMTEAGKRSTTLKVTFGKNNKVKDYKSSVSID
jgi:hypothetical protein